MTSTLTSLALLAAPWLAGANPEPAANAPVSNSGSDDLVVLKSGKKIKGRVIREGPQEVVIRVGSSTRTVARDKIESIDSLERDLRTLLQFQDRIDLERPEGWIDLGRFANSRDLDAFGRLAFVRALTLDPKNEIARTALGLQEGRTSNSMDVGGRRVSVEELTGNFTDRESWKRRWTLETPHFTIETNLEIDKAIDAALDIERFYFFFYDVIGDAIGLYHVEDPNPVEIHAGGDSFPLAADPDRPAWFDPQNDTLYVKTTLRLNRLLLFHEVTHMLMDHGFLEGGSSGEIPPWADEGLAEYLSIAAKGPYGRVVFEPGEHHDFHFIGHGNSDDPMELRKLLNLGRGAFLSGGEVDQAYAQSYTLVHFLLEDRRTALNDRFFRFLESARAGKGGGAHFIKEFGGDEDELEEAWHTYARRIASGRRGH